MARAVPAARCRRGRGLRGCAEPELPFTRCLHSARRQQAAGSTQQTQQKRREGWNTSRRVSGHRIKKIPMLRLKKMRASGRRQLTDFGEISELIKRRVDSDRVICLAFFYGHGRKRGTRKETDGF